jgi:hypothetical protein
MTHHRRQARRSWLARHHDWIVLAVVTVPMLHCAWSPPKS